MATRPPQRSLSRPARATPTAAEDSVRPCLANPLAPLLGAAPARFSFSRSIATPRPAPLSGSSRAPLAPKFSPLFSPYSPLFFFFFFDRSHAKRASARFFPNCERVAIGRGGSRRNFRRRQGEKRGAKLRFRCLAFQLLLLKCFWRRREETEERVLVAPRQSAAAAPSAAVRAAAVAGVPRQATQRPNRTAEEKARAHSKHS